MSKPVAQQPVTGKHGFVLTGYLLPERENGISRFCKNVKNVKITIFEKMKIENSKRKITLLFAAQKVILTISLSLY